MYNLFYNNAPAIALYDYQKGVHVPRNKVVRLA